MTDEEKMKAVEGFLKLTSQHILDFYTMLGLESHIEATIINDQNGEKFKFLFYKVEP